MTKEKVRLLVPLSILGAVLIYCWLSFLFTPAGATWKHYLGIGLFAGIVYFFFANPTIATIATGIYLLMATFNLLALTPIVSTFGIKVGPVSTPDIQLMSLGLFIVYLVLNVDQLADIYLDYKESDNNHKL